MNLKVELNGDTLKNGKGFIMNITRDNGRKQKHMDSRNGRRLGFDINKGKEQGLQKNRCNYWSC
jgi:hypothetical protein